ncbi:quaternary amine ABC transporter ATP-binding protein [Bordetella holmesii]|uniref:Quaternary amine transport ATP-binding protein n=2 Tax=Bordetella holmesii TaxID=35814 RepID=A0A158M782_9BORD|nr:glycine betaine/L-proline ABC transporter ATP-binding protein [Bordetella holmesii]AHV92791.1 glycine betaine/L-proline transport ATP binding subunit [Bordetella holmesii ATCC 51541]AIT25434.1 glycine betaine/L-proline transport ATP binding subunit [Bordetella holmesii 44057]EWM45996.1 glycine betaine/L-proline transport ATP binding subunit [Bordetella holmesii 70147]EWM48250.1 glycine betaine/L-proline transport ATP binding subunit [Bordetella holmesii 41130]EWM50130.1 glycine betaine/L-pr
MSKIEVKNIYKIFGPHPQKCLKAAQDGISKEALLAETGHTLGLRNISLSIDEGSIFVIMGLSGSGKSTLIRHFNRLIEPSAGQILVDGVDVVSLNKRDLEAFRQKKMSMVFQRFGLFPHRTVLDNAAYGLAVQGVSRAKREERARHWLDQVGLNGFESQYPHQLSGGMQQRVGLARALATDAEILLMDEAFSALDPLIRREMQDHLLQLQAKLNKTIVFITHDLDEALRLGNRIAILKGGELVQEGTPEDILLSPANDYVQAFLQDVNRTKVLNAAHAVNPSRLTLTMRSRPAHSLERMQALNYEYAPVLGGKRLAGILTGQAAMLAQQEGARDVSRYVEDLASVPATAGLDQVLSQLVHSDQPLAVTGEDDEFLGMLSRKKVVELVAPVVAESNEAAVSAEPAAPLDPADPEKLPN